MASDLEIPLSQVNNKYLEKIPVKPARFKPYTHDWKIYYAGQRRILYVGKATDGLYDPGKVSEWWGKKPSAFWNFAQRVSRLAKPDVENMSNLVWSNLVRQGVPRGNPISKDIARESPRLSDTLREEVKEFRPDLIVLVNAGYHESIVNEAFRITRGEPGDVTQYVTQGQVQPKYDLWYREAWQEFPALVWMRHPQGKPKGYVDEAYDLVKKVTGW